jgi:hypothetical protein
MAACLRNIAAGPDKFFLMGRVLLDTLSIVGEGRVATQAGRRLLGDAPGHTLRQVRMRAPTVNSSRGGGRSVLTGRDLMTPKLLDRPTGRSSRS